MPLVDVAELVPRLHEVVAGVQVAVRLERGAVAAGRGVDAEKVPPQPPLERHVEQLHEDPAHVPPNPLLEDVDQEAAVLLPAHRALRHQAARLGVEEPLPPRPVAPALVGQRDRLFRRPLDDRDELHPLRAELVAQEAVDGPPVRLVGRVHRAQDVEVDPVPAQGPPALHDAVEGAPPAAVDPVGVVHLAGAVDAQADEERVLLEEGAPLVVEQESVRLEGVLHALPGTPVLLDERHRVAEELDAHQRRLAALPGHGDLGRAVGLEQLAEVLLERGRGHAALLAGVESLLGQEEAVGAVDVAGGPARLGQQVEARGGHVPRQRGAGSDRLSRRNRRAHRGKALGTVIATPPCGPWQEPYHGRSALSARGPSAGIGARMPR